MKEDEENKERKKKETKLYLSSIVPHTFAENHCLAPPTRPNEELSTITFVMVYRKVMRFKCCVSYFSCIPTYLKP